MPKKEELIEPIPATMEEIVEAIFANHPEPRDPEKEKNFSDRVTHFPNHSDFPPKSEKSQK